MNKIYIDREEIYDILCDCGLMTIYTRDYGSLEMTDENNIMDDFIPNVIEYINSKLENQEIIIN